MSVQAIESCKVEDTHERLKLLFLARPFPPLQATACTRTWNTAKYLSRLGWDITVVTLDPSVRRHIDSPAEIAVKLRNEGIKQILTGHRWRFLRPRSLNCWNSGVGWLVGGLCRRIVWHLGIDRDIGWIGEAKKACSNLSKGDVDVILATGSPFASFKLARQLAERLDCPYVLDYRDPWTQNPHRPSANRPKVVREEKRLLVGSAAVTIVSPSWGEALDRRFGIRSKLHVIANGYDPEELDTVKPYDFGHFAIVYAGNFYPPKRVISPVMAALKRIKESANADGADWRFHYYGRDENHVLQEATRFAISERVVSHGWVPQTDVWSAVRGAGLAVVITSVDDDASHEDKGIMTGKIYETLGLGTPVLLIAPNGSDLELLAKQTSSVRVFAGSRIEAMAGFVRELQFGSILNGNRHETFAWPSIAKELDELLRQVVQTNSRVHDSGDSSLVTN